jgi:aryl-alcohol dehydrogenase (NADP+)
MQYAKLGKSDLNVSRICLGMMSYGTPKWREWVLKEEESYPIIRHAWELGINFWDTANMYSQGVSEEVTGKALKKFAKREDIILASKVFYPAPGLEQGLSKEQIAKAIEDSLKRLATDYIDLYQIHRWDYNTPIEETLEALHKLVQAGKVRYIGASSMYAHQFAKSLYLADLRKWTRFVSMQNHYNLVYREEEREMNRLCVEEGVGLIPWSPLARGFLAGNRTAADKGGATTRAKSDQFAKDMYYADEDFQIVERLHEVAKAKGAKPTQIALAWLLAKPGVVAPIIGATKAHYIDEAVAALDMQLTEEETRKLEELYIPHPVRGHS